MNRTLSGDVHYSDGEFGISQCVWCRHRSSGGRCCRAFPNGIPEEILKDRHDHREAYVGDSGVRFQPEVVEIEFVDVDSEPDFVALSADLAIAVARAGDSNVPEGDAEIVHLDGPEFELDEDGVDLGAAASG